jgi:hypothetical protein
MCLLVLGLLCRLYQKLDWLMLLAEGHLMYYGKADQVGLRKPTGCRGIQGAGVVFRFRQKFCMCPTHTMCVAHHMTVSQRLFQSLSHR